MLSRSSRRGAATIAGLALVSTRFGGVPPADAETLACGQVVTESVTLTADVGPCAGDGIIVGADDVTINLNGYRILGTPERADNVGIRLPMRLGVSIGNGAVSDFGVGVFINGGADNGVFRMTIEDNAGLTEFGDGILMLNSDGNRITSNKIRRNGAFDGIGVLGVSDGNVITRNLVEDNSVPFQNGLVRTQGIGIGDGSEGTSISGTVVADNVVRGSAGSGIFASFETTGTVVRRNLSEANGFDQLGPNGQIGFGVPAGIENRGGNNGLFERNIVRGNAAIGIWNLVLLASGSAGGIANRFIDNQAAGNAALADSPDDVNGLVNFFNSLDLLDLGLVDRTSCGLGQFIPGGDNVWSGNTWGPYPGTSLGSYFPECTGIDGFGPRPSALAQFFPSAAAASTTAEAGSDPFAGLETPRPEGRF